MVFKLFPSLFDRPAKIQFIEQEEGESIELFLRQHPIVNLPWVVLAVFGTVLPVLLIVIDQAMGLNLLNSVPNQTLIGALLIWYLLILAYVIENFVFWYFNIYIVTNFNIVDLDFDSLLARKITEIRLNDIESVSSDISGIFGSLFNFGDVNVETAAKHQAVQFLKVPRPDFVSDRIEDLRSEVKGGGE